MYCSAIYSSVFRRKYSNLSIHWDISFFPTILPCECACQVFWYSPPSLSDQLRIARLDRAGSLVETPISKEKPESCKHRINSDSVRTGITGPMNSSTCAPERNFIVALQIPPVSAEKIRFSVLSPHEWGVHFGDWRRETEIRDGSGAAVYEAVTVKYPIARALVKTSV